MIYNSENTSAKKCLKIMYQTYTSLFKLTIPFQFLTVARIIDVLITSPTICREGVLTEDHQKNMQLTTISNFNDDVDFARPVAFLPFYREHGQGDWADFPPQISKEN